MKTPKENPMKNVKKNTKGKENPMKAVKKAKPRNYSKENPYRNGVGGEKMGY